ncbi:hypothetical protein VTI74DRAFT_5639 [Chaetomium olivicolor]
MGSEIGRTIRSDWSRCWNSTPQHRRISDKSAVDGPIPGAGEYFTSFGGEDGNRTHPVSQCSEDASEAVPVAADRGRLGVQQGLNPEGGRERSRRSPQCSSRKLVGRLFRRMSSGSCPLGGVLADRSAVSPSLGKVKKGRCLVDLFGGMGKPSRCWMALPSQVTGSLWARARGR